MNSQECTKVLEVAEEGIGLYSWGTRLQGALKVSGQEGDTAGS